METGDILNEFFQDVQSGEPPKIVIDLSLSESKYNWGASGYALDMSWYARYKPEVDSLLSAMMWLFFIWRVFVALPGIIAGTAGMVDDYREFEKQNAAAEGRRMRERTRSSMRSRR